MNYFYHDISYRAYFFESINILKQQKMISLDGEQIDFVLFEMKVM